MNDSTHDDATHAALRKHLDAHALTPRELDRDLALVLARRPRRRSLIVSVALPSAFAAAALALFVVARAPAAVAPSDGAPVPREDDNSVHIYVADSDDPASAIVIDFALQGETP